MERRVPLNELNNIIDILLELIFIGSKIIIFAK
jgi:hypothetical protein